MPLIIGGWRGRCRTARSSAWTSAATASMASSVQGCPTREATALAGVDRRLADAAQREPDPGAAPLVVERHDRRDAGQGKIAAPARHFHEAGAGARLRLAEIRSRPASRRTAISVVSSPWKNADAATSRSPVDDLSRIRASIATASAGSSEAGSACDRLPPIVPRLRICGWAMCGSASANSGQACQEAAVALEVAIARQRADPDRLAARLRRRPSP